MQTVLIIMYLDNELKFTTIYHIVLFFQASSFWRGELITELLLNWSGVKLTGPWAAWTLIEVANRVFFGLMNTIETDHLCMHIIELQLN